MDLLAWYIIAFNPQTTAWGGLVFVDTSIWQMCGARGEVVGRPRALEALEKDVTMSSTFFASATATASGTQVALLGPNFNCSSDLPLSGATEALQMMPATAREDLKCTRSTFTEYGLRRILS